MDNLIKAFHFESESIELILNIKKEVFHDSNGLKMFIDGELILNNSDLIKHESVNGTSQNKSLTYKNKTIFWISSNNQKGLRWKNYNNATGFTVYHSVKEMKDQYIEQREFITKIADYFYNCVKQFMEIKLLYETPLDDVVTEEQNHSGT